jgi:hypothetical protein
MANKNKFQKTCDDIFKEQVIIQDRIMKNHWDVVNPEKKTETNKTDSSLKALLAFELPPKMLEGVQSYATGITCYIEKSRADMLKCSDTFLKMSNLALYRMGGNFVQRYDEYAKAADVDDCPEKEYVPFKLDKIGRNQLIMQRLSRSISDSHKKLFKNKKE